MAQQVFRFRSERSLPMWSIVHYLNRLSTHYFKLLTLERIGDVLSKNISHKSILIASESAALMSSTPFEYDSKLSYISLEDENFWRIMKTHHRPAVFHKQGDSFEPLISIEEDDLLISRLTVTSPPDITLSGIASTLQDLFYAQQREERQRQEHQNRQIGQVAQNISQMASAQVMLNNPNLDAGVKMYLETLMLDIMKKQGELNKEMQLHAASVDTKA